MLYMAHTTPRRMPRHFLRIAYVAAKAKLPNPMGRALYFCNRIQNGDYDFACMLFETTTEQELVAKLRLIRPETATRWRAHWLAGNSIKSLSWGKAGRKSRAK